MLRQGCVTFGSFNNLAKVTPDVLAVWANLLARVPGARLLLKRSNFDQADERRRIAADFAAAGGDLRRLELRGWSDHAAMLAEYGEVDIGLDPFPFCGGLTSCEALWMGVPVVTLAGATPVSRQTLGFLTQVGLHRELAACSRESYLAIAAGLANDADRLAALRLELRERVQASPLCDADRFARHLEAAFRDLWTAKIGPAR
jgi:predicted O-linked N-acetylglucosamine transferase (SPINDLY family)